MTLKVFLGFS